LGVSFTYLSINLPASFPISLPISLPIKPLVDCGGDKATKEHSSIPFKFDNYLTLVDVTGRLICEGKPRPTLLLILERLAIDRNQSIKNSTPF
jgi:hypothetical protein